MTLHVSTAPYGYPAGPDRLDVTRAGVDRALRAGDPTPGAPFAPSPRILWPAMAHLELVEALVLRATTLPPGEAAATTAGHAATLLSRVEDAYERLYRAEMRQSYRDHRGSWNELLSRDQVTLVCFCPRRVPGPSQRHTCHRHHLAGMLVACGAIDEGELETVATPSQRHDKRLPGPDALVAVSGTRPPRDPASAEQWAIYEALAHRARETIAALPAGTTVLHGGADGIDTVAEQAARKAGLATVTTRPWYDAFGREAPKVRNVYVCAAPRLLAFPSPWGTGTQHAVGLARAAGVDVDERAP